MMRTLVSRVLLLLLTCTFTKETPVAVYVLVGRDQIVLNGSDIAPEGTVVWEWTQDWGQNITKALAEMTAHQNHWRVKWLQEDTAKEWRQINKSLGLTMENPEFETSGLFTCRQTEPQNRTLSQYQVFTVKVDQKERCQSMDAEVTLSCSISRLPDGVRLQWKHRESAQNSSSNDTDQLQINNMLYLMIKANDSDQYTCAVQDGEEIVLTSDTKQYIRLNGSVEGCTHYWPVTDQHAMVLGCESSSRGRFSTWHWTPQSAPNGYEEIASCPEEGQTKPPIPGFQDRILVTCDNSTSFTLQISPVHFRDAGLYTCDVNSVTESSVRLATIKVTVNPSPTLSAGESAQLTCAVSGVTGGARPVWMDRVKNNILEGKLLNGSREGDVSVSLLVKNIGEYNRDWACVLLNGTIPLAVIRYRFQIEENVTPGIIFLSLGLVHIFCTILTIMCYVQKVNTSDRGDQSGLNFNDIALESTTG
uniref:Uncharacterized LOC103184117 n=1 Tax=Callorhinchus milii TaxID=7868 RepID=A0A4W3JUA3_CALMI